MATLSTIKSKALAQAQAHLMLPKDFQSHRDVIAFYDSRYYNLIESGEAHPFLYPWASLGALLVLVSLLIDYRRSRARRCASYAAFTAMCVFQLWTIATNKGRNPAASFGVGLISSFGIMWTAAIVIFNDCQRDFRRIERAEGGEMEALPEDDVVREPGHANGVLTNGDAKINGGEHAIRQRRTAKKVQETATLGPRKRTGPLIWQSYPAGPLLERLDWVADIFCSFRGVGWNWQSSAIPPPPNWVEAQLKGEASEENHNEPLRTSKTGIRRFSDRRALLKANLTHLALAYIVLDAIKTLGIHDRYMWYGDHSLAPPAFLPQILLNSPFLTKSYRLLVCLCAINIALWAIFKLGPVFFVGMLGPRLVGVRGEAWMNPADMFGDFAHVLDNGLAGWWGSWWHQTFRYAFQQPGDRLVELLGLPKRSVAGKLVATWMAFFLSGVLHATGSYTQLGDTRPLSGPMAFFMLQALGVTVQAALVHLLEPSRVFPRSVRRAANFAIVAVWMYFTAPLLVDDFARGGIWLFEPVPISIFRGLGLGPKGEGWWCWYGGLMEWRSGKGWWDSGIAL
ncbi:hypothetical protein Q7P37_005326 [Cladosporium fusiforme]